MKNPFVSSIFDPASVTVPSIHQRELDSLSGLTRGLEGVSFNSSGEGASVLLTAPRAGAGKSHLLARCQAKTSERMIWIPFRFGPEQDLSWRQLTLELVARLTGPGPDDAATLLDETAWFAFSRLVRAGLDQGKVDSGNPEAARLQLDTRFREIFVPASPENRSRWFASNAESLLASSGAAGAAALGGDGVAFTEWMRWLTAFAYAKSGSGERIEKLRARLAKASGTNLTWKNRFQMLARLASGLRPVIWSVDQLDRFFADPQAARLLISQLAEVVALVPRSLLVISANQDLWQQVFLPGVPSALQDRLVGHEIHLSPLSAAQAEELIAARLLAAGLPEGPVGEVARTGALTPRAILRSASSAWEMREVAPEPTPHTEETLTVLKARERLHAVAEALRMQSGPPIGIAAPAATSPNPLPRSLAEHFQAMRLRHLAGGVTTPDLKRIHRLVATIGDRFPSIRQRALESGPTIHGEALCWAIANREVYIGFAPPTSYRFWRQLAAAASPDSENSARRVVMLVPAGEPVALDRLNAESAAAFDVVTVDSDLAASLHAADELVQTMQRGESEFADAKLFGFLAKELDFFWRRLTRFPKAKAQTPTEIAEQPA